MDVLNVILVASLVAAVFLISGKSKANRTLLTEIGVLKNNIELLEQALSTTREELADKTEENNQFRNKYSNIIDVDNEVLERQAIRSAVEMDIEALRQVYKEKKAIFDKLVLEAAIYDDTVELAELGIYTPRYLFESSEEYRVALEAIREKQKEMVRNKSAIICTTEWEVHGSKSEGRKMTNRSIRLASRAFNNECDAAIANTRWNNVVKMIERIRVAYEKINKLNDVLQVYITSEYLDLKLQELQLCYEQQEARQKEREEQVTIRQKIREEAKLQEELDLAQKEEAQYQKLLERAQREAAKASGDELNELSRKVEKLTADLAVAHAKSQRALSMAQQTKAGHVYVISNVGSFGEDVFKIGMTRRLEPLDRVKELGDASVPFIFDVHAMIFCEDAPALESQLHKKFARHRLNLVNNRKEFFRIQLDQVEAAVKESGQVVNFIKTQEAREYRESQMVRARFEKARTENDVREKFPVEI